MTKNLIPILENEIIKAQKYQKTLEHSLKKALDIELKSFDDYSLDELDILESLTSRFARSSDILIKKIFRVIESIDLEEKGTIRDLINQAEKKNLISSSDEFIRIRELRNLIAHEYQEDDLNSIFKEVLRLTPIVIHAIDSTATYSKKYALK